MSRRLRWGAVLLPALIGAGLWGAAPVHAAGGYSVDAPYTAGSHSGTTTCAQPDVAPHCAASAEAQPATGVMRAHAYTDSGADGNLPGSGESTSLSQIDQAIDMHRWSRALVILHINVSKATVSSTGVGRSYLYVSAQCGSCADEAPYQFVDGPQDVQLRLEVDRSGTAAPVVVETNLEAITYVNCDQFFCPTPTGTAEATGAATLTRIDVAPR